MRGETEDSVCWEEWRIKVWIEIGDRNNRKEEDASKGWWI